MVDRPLYKVLVVFVNILVRILDLVTKVIGASMMVCCASSMTIIWTRRIILFLLISVSFCGLLITVFQQYSSMAHQAPRYTRLVMSEAMLAEYIVQSMPNQPLVYWFKNASKSKLINKTCARFPSAYNLQYNNVYWQTLQTSNETLQLFGAYLDNRTLNKRGASVRVLGMIDSIKPTEVMYCQLWFGYRKKPLVVRVVRFRYIWNEKWRHRDGPFQPCLMECVLPRSFKHVPDSVSLVENVCDNATNNLRVVYNKPAVKKDFAVCVKGLDFLHEDLSVRLVEWIELLSLLGADKIFFYELQVHPNISKVLNYYVKEGNVHVTPLTLAGGQPNSPLLLHRYLKQNHTHVRRNEVIPYNDCFYRHMYEYKYIVALDVDEVIVPTASWSWRRLMFDVLSKNHYLHPGSFNFKHVYFPDDLEGGGVADVPEYMHMLQHVHRAKRFSQTREHSKCFCNTERVLILDSNQPLACLGACGVHLLPTSEARLHHYRTGCPEERKNCHDRNNTVVDTTIWRFKKPLIARVTAALRRLGYFK